MKLTAEMQYAATPEQVYAMLVDPQFYEQVCAATGALEHSVDIEEAGGGVTITSTRKLPADELPDFIRTFVGATLDVLRVDHWGPAAPDGSREGTVVVEIVGTPVRLRGTAVLMADAGVTRERITGDLHASVPLLGGKIERASEPAVRAAIAKEQEIGDRWLA